MSSSSHDASASSAQGQSRKLKRKGGTGNHANGQSRQAHHPGHPQQGRNHHQQQQQQMQMQQQLGMTGPPLKGGPMGWGTAFDDEGEDFALDEMDRVTPRDLAVARFRRNHEFMEGIFDERKIANLQPLPSPYADLSASGLREQLTTATDATAEAQRDHKERMKALRLAADPDQLEREVSRQHKRFKEEDAKLDSWARSAGEGRVVSWGFGYVRAKTPESIRTARHEQRREAKEEEQRLRAGSEKQQESSASTAPQPQGQAEPAASLAQAPSSGPGAPVSTTTDVATTAPPAASAEAQPPLTSELTSIPDASSQGDAGDEDAEGDAEGDDDDEDEDEQMANVTTGGDEKAPEAGASSEAAKEPSTTEPEPQGEEVQIVQNTEDDGQGAAAPVAPLAAAGQPQALSGESETLSHPLSAEAEAASHEQKAESAPSTALASAPADTEQQEQEQKQEQEKQPQPADVAVNDAEEQTNTAATQTQNTPADAVMKAPTPTLEEKLGENDAPKEMGPPETAA